MEPSLADLSKTVDVCQTDHLPVIAAFCRDLKIDKIVNRLVPSEMNLDPGTVVIGMILDTWIHTPSAHRFGRLREA